MRKYLKELIPWAAIAGIATVLYLFIGTGSAEPKFDPNGGPKAFVSYVDSVMDSMPKSTHKLRVSDADITEWALEILPYYAYEGLVDFPKLPDSISLTPFLGAEAHNHILGQAYCTAPGSPYASLNIPSVVELNLRLANPHSPWYQDAERFLPTLVHELIHIQGVCGNGELSESSDQVVTLEILAALVNHGNTEAVYPLLSELRSIGLATVQYQALEQGTDEAIADYKKFRDKILDNDPVEIARSEKSWRYWGASTAGKTRLEYILRAYNSNVWDQIATSFKTGFAPKLYIPPYWGDGRAPSVSSVMAYSGHREFKMDDLNYFLRHASEIAADVRR